MESGLSTSSNSRSREKIKKRIAKITTQFIGERNKKGFSTWQNLIG